MLDALQQNDLTADSYASKMLSPAVERFLRSERNRREQRSVTSSTVGLSVKKLMGSLQRRFLQHSDLSEDLANMVENQVQQRTRELFRQANYDSLTHLPNRAYFNATLEQLVVQARQADSHFSLLFLDLDGFKPVNDNLGHQAGDELLRNVSARLISAVRDGDIVSRLGGDEFVILLANLADRDLIEGICQRIIVEVSRPYFIHQKDVMISTSIGVARFPEDAKTSAELIQNADEALYVSKSSGRRAYRFYDQVMSQAPTQSHVMQHKFEIAMEQGHIKSCFEAQMDLSSQKIVGASLSAQWNCPALATPYLSSWVEFLNKSDWAYSMGAWLLDTGLHYLQQWQLSNPELVVSVPILNSVWQREAWPALLEQRLNHYQVNRAQLQLEFSMQALEKADPLFTQTLNALSDAGYQITLTDVGKYALDLTQLAHLNVHELKLDRTWLHNALQTEKGRKWVRAIIQMAKSLDVCVIATGIDTPETQQWLTQMGCSMGQGQIWSSPVAASEFAQALL
ncbi:putative bifunctional diguanylate cyclase/phosphodiesterase [Thiomicrorhabdus aquaedulcis]|uniref:putative bifunctional diguanylate cyclase/phosphodiesterase n=1 Tax=Thiomicrorhabdus aquaedulcis TaxID=2211106 RepID=UPI000FD7FD66|nr:diguanylate cyclase [Thiomicrorhabdus aquaedulcis]